MSNPVSIMNGIVRRAIKVASGVERNLRMSVMESAVVTQFEGPGVQLAAKGLCFSGGGQSTATGRAPVTAIPTTAAAFMLHNNEPDGGFSYVIDALHATMISGTAGVGSSLWWAITTTKIAAPTAATGYASFNRARSSSATKAVFADAQTLSATPTWVCGQATGNPAVLVGGGISAFFDHRPPVVPPGYAIVWTVLSGAGSTPLSVGSADWTEIELDLE